MRSIVAVLLVTAALAGCLRGDDPYEARADGTAESRVGDITSAPATVSFSGEGAGATDAFTLEVPVARVVFEHDGDGPFAFYVADGDVLAILAEGEGAAAGARYVQVPPGAYHVEVEGDGNWTVTVEQDADRKAAPAPATLNGTGAGAPTALVLASGTVTFNATHAGEGEFRARILDPDGRVLMGVGPIDGAGSEEVAFTVPEQGVYYVDVLRGGDWTVTVEQG